MPWCPSSDGDANAGKRSARPRVLRGRAVSARDRVRRAPWPVAAPSGASGAAWLRGRGALGGGGSGGAGEGAAPRLASARSEERRVGKECGCRGGADREEQEGGGW